MTKAPRAPAPVRKRRRTSRGSESAIADVVQSRCNAGPNPAVGQLLLYIVGHSKGGAMERLAADHTSSCGGGYRSHVCPTALCTQV
ncbi:MAG: hypothetical protein ACT4QB_23345 [Gammaproteobacteria bacterium]